MANTDASRIEVREEKLTFVSPSLRGVLKEIDGRITDSDFFLKFIRSDGLISRVEYYRDEAKTNLAISRDFDRVSGTAGMVLVSSVVTQFFETDGVTLDSSVSSFLERDLSISGGDFIIASSGYFSSSECGCAP